MKSLIPMEIIEQRIFVIRGYKVILDADLANLYGVSTKVFNQAVKRHKRRFPPDFMFRLSISESGRMRSQSVTASKRNLRYHPLCFTEQGIAMLSGVLDSARAVTVNIMIMRAFVKLRAIITANKDLAARLDKLESRYDAQFKAVFEAVRELIYSPKPPKKRIGFTTKEKSIRYTKKGNPVT